MKENFTLEDCSADIDALMNDPYAHGMRHPDLPQVSTQGRTIFRNNLEVTQLPLHSEYVISTYGNDRLHHQQTRFAMSKGLSDEDIRVISLFSGVVGFPTCAACPSASYSARDLTNNSFAVLNRKDLKWYVQGANVVTLRCPTFGMYYLTKEVDKCISYHGSTRQRYNARRVTVKIDGVQYPILTVSDGRRYLVRILNNVLNVVRVHGYSGDFLEYDQKTDTYYGHGPGRLYFNLKEHKYVDLYTLSLEDDSEGVVIDYELLSAKVVRQPTLDLKVDDGTAYDADGTIILTDRRLSKLDKGIYEIDVSDVTDPKVLRRRLDRTTANESTIVARLSSAISIDQLVLYPPYNTPVLVNSAAPKALASKGIGLKPKQAPVVPFVHNAKYSRSSYKEFTKLLRGCVHNNFLSSSQLCKKMRKLGCSFDYECLKRYIGWCGFYSTRDGWVYVRYKIPAVFTCSRMYDAARPCKCIEIRKRKLSPEITSSGD